MMRREFKSDGEVIDFMLKLKIGETKTIYYLGNKFQIHKDTPTKEEQGDDKNGRTTN